MFVISREQAICLFYGVPYNKENEEKYTKKIDEMEDVDVCYTKNQKKPRLLCTRIIYANSFDIHLYPSGSRQEKPDKEIGQSNQEVGNRKLEIETTPQLKQFLNIAYLSEDPESVLYECKALSMNTILSHVWEYTSLFKKDNFSKFTNWCRTQKLNFITTSVKRKHEDSSPTSRSILRNLYVLKDQHKDALIEDIVNLPIQYQQYIMDLKIQGYFIIGYCRKSKTTADNEKVTKCLQSMVLGLKERSLAQKVYVTVSCNAGTPFKKRDLKKNAIIDQLSGISGNAQDLLQDIQKINKVALVIIDSAGLTTNFTDLEAFLRENSNIQKIIIDTIVHDNQVHVINCQEELVEPKALFKFDSRENLYHRSKN